MTTTRKKAAVKKKAKTRRARKDPVLAERKRWTKALQSVRRDELAAAIMTLSRGLDWPFDNRVDLKREKGGKCKPLRIPVPATVNKVLVTYWTLDMTARAAAAFVDYLADGAPQPVLRDIGIDRDESGRPVMYVDLEEGAEAGSFMRPDTEPPSSD